MEPLPEWAYQLVTTIGIMIVFVSGSWAGAVIAAATLIKRHNKLAAEILSDASKAMNEYYSSLSVKLVSIKDLPNGETHTTYIYFAPKGHESVTPANETARRPR